MGILIDSTVLILAERNRRSPEQLVSDLLQHYGDLELSLSAMSAGELFHGCWRAAEPARRAAREEFVEAILAAIPVVPIALPIMRIFGRIDAELSARGQRVPTSDLLIASTALSQGDDLVTGNPRHFERVPGLTIHLHPS